MHGREHSEPTRALLLPSVVTACVTAVRWIEVELPVGKSSEIGHGGGDVSSRSGVRRPL